MTTPTHRAVTAPRLRIRTGRAARLAGVVGLAAMALAACVPGPVPGGGTTTTTTQATSTTTASTTRTLTNASFEWTVSRETDSGTFAPGQVNYWSAGPSDSTSATYVPTNGNATVLKKNAAGTYVPIGSESSVGWDNRTKNGAGVAATATGTTYLGQKVRFTGGTGTVDTATGNATIQWTGTFSINFYGKYVPFWISSPKLVVTNGVGKLTATVAGFASTLDNPDVRTPLPSTSVTLADLPAVAGANAVGFTAATAYVGTAVTTPSGAPQVAPTAANGAFWGAWPQSFVDFQQATGLGTYWYTSGGATDWKKAQEPIVVSYGLTA